MAGFTQAEYLAFLKILNAKYKTAGSAAVLGEQLALRNEIQNTITALGGNPALWDYAAGTSLMAAGTGNAASSTLTIPHDFIKCGTLLRFVTTIGATPTATYAIQGDQKSDFSSPVTLTYSDSATPATFVATTFAITTATTVIKYVAPGQPYKFLRVNVTANTNVTTTIDAIYLGGDR